MSTSKFKIVFLTLMATALSACTFVGTNEVGVKTTYGGQVSLEEISEGVTLSIPPFVTVQKFSEKIITVNITDKPMQPVSAEGQELEKFDAEIYYSVNSDKIADIVVKYSGKHGHDGKVYLPARERIYSLARSQARDSVSKIPSLQMTGSRDSISKDIMEELQATLDLADPDTFYISEVNIRDIKPNRNIAASAAKNVNTQNEAEAKLKEIGIAATQAEINEKLAPSITPELIEMRKLDIEEMKIKMMLEACTKGSCTFFVDSISSASPILPISAGKKPTEEKPVE